MLRLKMPWTEHGPKAEIHLLFPTELEILMNAYAEQLPILTNGLLLPRQRERERELDRK